MTETILNIGTDFDSIDNQAKAWVYTSNQEFTEEQLELIQKYAEVFLSQWDSHGKLVKGAIQVLKNRFIAVFADTEGDTMCGRAQDSSVKFIKELEEILNVKLMDRMLVAFNYNGEINTLSFNQLKSKFGNGEISSSTQFYNGLITSKQEFVQDWERPIEGSWI